jgi:Rrf2 family iron-sulfur cluster assembly transcriptional regulator
MILTTRGRYAIMAIIDMIEIGDQKPITLSVISKRQKISLSYLEQIFSKLRKSGIVNAVKGPGGGYLLAQDTKITAADVIRAIEEKIKMTKCDSDNCKSSNTKCKTHDIWKGLEVSIYSYFESIIIKDK